MYLEKKLRPEEASISLVNEENYFVYQPMLPEVISGSIGLTDVVSPIRRLCRRTKLVMRQVEEIDLENRTVTLSPGFRPRRMEMSFDYLVIGLGGVTNFYGMPGMVEHAMPFRTLSDAVALRNRVIHTLEEADVETDGELRRKLLTFVVAGGGFSGVEVIAELNDFVRAVARNYPRIPREEIRCVLVHSGDRILPEMVERLAVFAETLLTKRGSGDRTERPFGGGYFRKGDSQVRSAYSNQDDRIDGPLRRFAGTAKTGLPEEQRATACRYTAATGGP